MKNTTRIIIIVLAFAISSCAMLKKDDNHQEEMKKVDAYALAHAQCAYELVLMQHLDSLSDIQLKQEYTSRKEELIDLKWSYYVPYNYPKQEFIDFQELVKKLSPELTSCKKLEEYKILKEQETTETEKETKK